MKVIQHSNKLTLYRLIDRAWPKRNDRQGNQHGCEDDMPKPLVAEVPQAEPQ